MKTKIIFCLTSFLFLLLITENVHSCTIFYITDGKKVYAGNNEDWEDPATRMWIIPSANGKNGWIKFGFANGYPQGGVNEKGVFWDGTANAFLAMPESEENKVIYQGNIMQKVLEECGSIQETLSVFSKYYCQDQYHAQYLVGDDSGNSIIVEGDYILHKDSSYQVLTNFYHSHPDLGGYPCWRHETVCDMLSRSTALDPYLIGSVLSATHQEGRYPTQYSNIYDLKERVIYLFYYHNYEEFIKIDIKEEMKKGSRTYKLPELFSKVKIVSPEEDQVVVRNSVTFQWEGKTDSKYEIIYSTHEDFKNTNKFSANTMENSYPEKLFSSAWILLLVFGVLLKKRNFTIVIGILMMVTVFTQCKKDTPEPGPATKLFSNTVTNLQGNTTYYWKVKATSNKGADFSSESIVQSFTTKSQ